MSKYKFLLLLCISVASTCCAKEPFNDHNLAIHTYGGGELFQRVFQSISMLLYGNGSENLSQMLTAIIRICLAVGAFSAFCLTLSRFTFEPLLKNFFLPAIGIISCLLVPRTTLLIKDHLAEKSPSSSASVVFTVPNVPFIVGKLASVISTVSYKFTQSMETIAHGTGETSSDTLYDWTGHIYAGDNIFQTKKWRISNPILEDNFREFCRECVFRDLGIGIYSKNDLLHTPNVLEFLEKNTSRIRTCFYRDITEEGQTSSLGSFLTCKEAIKKMNTLFGQQQGNTKNILFGEIGNDFQYLLNMKKADESELKKLIKQQMAISLLKEEIPGTLHSFASKRAELLQKENQKTLGALGVSTIVEMRNYFEAVIYMVFPLVILISLVAFGIKPLIHWTQFILWVNTWPPFYVVVKFLLNTIWSFRSKMLFGNTFGLTVFTSEGLSDLYSSMESIAAMSLAFIPFLSWMILQGGVSQMVHLASSLTAPAQSAATTASAETVYGNYNLGNVNLDNINGYNAQTFRQTYSGMLSTGSVNLDSGTETITYASNSDSLYIKQADSYLREGISKTQSFNRAVQDSLTTSQSSLTETSKGYSDNLADSSTKAAGFIQALSKQFQSGENYSTQELLGLQEAVQYMQGIGNDYAKAAGISNDQALRETVSAGIGISLGLKGDVSGNAQDGVSKSGGNNILEKSFDSEAFQKHFQTISNASTGEIGSILGSEDLRLHEDFSASWNQTKSLSEQYRSALSEHNALSKLSSYASSDNLSIHQNLNQRFVEFLNQKYSDTGVINEVLEMPNETPQKEALIQEFVHALIPKNTLDQEKAGIEEKYNQFSAPFKELSSNTAHHSEHLRQTISHEGQQKIGHAYGETEQKAKTLELTTSSHLNQQKEHLESKKQKITHDYEEKKQSAETSINQSLFSHFSKKTVGGTLTANIASGVYNQLFGKSNNESGGLNEQ